MENQNLRMLVAVDFSPESRRAIRVARELSRRIAASIVLVHVRPYSDVGAAVAEDRGDLLKGRPGSLAAAIERHYRARLNALAREGATVEHRLLQGKPSLELRREARRGYDLLVIGTRGRGRVAGSLLGSTVQEMLTRCPIPLLVATPR